MLKDKQKHSMGIDIPTILDNIRVAYEYEMGEHLEPQTRRNHKVELRNALVNAARPYGTCRQLATMIGKVNHTTAVHSMREHEVFFNSSPQYRKNYAVALEVVEKFARRHQLLPRVHGQRGSVVSMESDIEAINVMIASLQSRRNSLSENLHERRKSSTFAHRSSD